MAPKVKIYSKDYCAYCVRAKQFFQNKNIAFEEIDLSNNFAEIERLKSQTNFMTLPQIFIDDIFIGGYSELIEKYNRGEVKL